ncbi:MAG: DNA gyrase inhibitor YacG [Proteobacteria bacterium]|nr:DNA gyrase inhibitor YacG [Pseudomonadota bacterium]
MGAIVRCPNCKKTSAWSPENPWRPFCSERCRMIDLGAWLAEDHRIPGEPAIDATADSDKRGD